MPRSRCGSTTRAWPSSPRATDGLSAVVSFVEESADHRLFIAAALLEDGEIRHVHRKLFLPTYGLFDERRFFAAGRRAAGRAVAAGRRASGSAICEDFWHLAVPQLLALDGAQILINVSSSPGRDLAATNEVGLGTATSWRTLMRTYAQLTTSFVVFCNRVGVDESISFWGGSEVIAPDRRGRSSARRSTTRACSPSTSPLADIRRERIAPAAAARRAPGAAASASSRGSSPSGPGWPPTRPPSPAPRPGLDVAPGEPPPSRSGSGPTRRAAPPTAARDRRPDATPARRSSCRPSWRSTPTSPAGSSPSSSAASSSQAGFERAVLGLSGGIDSALVAYLVAEAIGAERLLCVLMPYRTSSPASRGDAEAVVADLGCAERAGRDQPDGRRLLRADAGRASGRTVATRRCGAATSWPGCGWPSCTTGR